MKAQESAILTGVISRSRASKFLYQIHIFQHPNPVVAAILLNGGVPESAIPRTKYIGAAENRSLQNWIVIRIADDGRSRIPQLYQNARSPER